MSRTDYLRRVRRAESPTGIDNTAGSGAYSHFQFMPATGHAYAQRTAWGKGLTPDQVKATVKAEPSKAAELADLYTGDSDGALKGAGLPVNDTNRFALHRFGQGGGVSLLRADAGMPVADWVRSVQWGQGITPEAVIKQNGLDRYVNVGDLRTRFIASQIGGAAPVRDDTAVALPVDEPPPDSLAAAFTPKRPMPMVDPMAGAIAAMFTQPQKKLRPKLRP